MKTEKSMTIQVRRGIRVNVQEVDTLEGDREIVAEAPPGLKIAVRQAPSKAVGGSINKITMCG